MIVDRSKTTSRLNFCSCLHVHITREVTYNRDDLRFRWTNPEIRFPKRQTIILVVQKLPQHPFNRFFPKPYTKFSIVNIVIFIQKASKKQLRILMTLIDTSTFSLSLDLESLGSMYLFNSHTSVILLKQTLLLAVPK